MLVRYWLQLVAHPVGTTSNNSSEKKQLLPPFWKGPRHYDWSSSRTRRGPFLLLGLPVLTTLTLPGKRLYSLISELPGPARARQPADAHPGEPPHADLARPRTDLTYHTDPSRTFHKRPSSILTSALGNGHRRRSLRSIQMLQASDEALSPR